MGAPAVLLLLALASILDFSQDHSTRLHSGAPPCAARYLLSGLKATLTTSCAVRIATPVSGNHTARHGPPLSNDQLLTRLPVTAAACGASCMQSF